MGISKLLYSALLAPISFPSFEPQDSCSLTWDPIKSVLYESYISIDALTFLIGTSRMSKTELDTVVNGILEVKKNILLDPKNAGKVFNISESINEKGIIKTLLEKRLNLIKKDESFIFKELIKNKQDEILKCVGLLKNKKLFDPKVDKYYKAMAFRIYDAIYENLDINETINREKEELYREYDQSITKDAIKRAKIAVSLGSSIFYLPELLKLIRKVNLKDKSKFIRDWINILFEPIEKLSISVASKNFIEQKYLVKEFIKNSIETGPANNAFEARTIIINAANLEIVEIKDLSTKQNEENKKLLKIIENVKEDTWLVKYNKEIKEDMILYLMTQQPEDKKKLLNHF